MLFNEDDSQEDLGPNLGGFLRKVENEYQVDDGDTLPLHMISKQLQGKESFKELSKLVYQEQQKKGPYKVPQELRNVIGTFKQISDQPIAMELIGGDIDLKYAQKVDKQVRDHQRRKDIFSTVIKKHTSQTQSTPALLSQKNNSKPLSKSPTHPITKINDQSDIKDFTIKMNEISGNDNTLDRMLMEYSAREKDVAQHQDDLLFADEQITSPDFNDRGSSPAWAKQYKNKQSQKSTQRQVGTAINSEGQRKQFDKRTSAFNLIANGRAEFETPIKAQDQRSLNVRRSQEELRHSSTETTDILIQAQRYRSKPGAQSPAGYLGAKNTSELQSEYMQTASTRSPKLLNKNRKNGYKGSTDTLARAGANGIFNAQRRSQPDLNSQKELYLPTQPERQPYNLRTLNKNEQ